MLTDIPGKEIKRETAKLFSDDTDSDTDTNLLGKGPENESHSQPQENEQSKNDSKTDFSAEENDMLHLQSDDIQEAEFVTDHNGQDKGFKILYEIIAASEESDTSKNTF